MTTTQSAPSGTRTTAIDPSAGAARRMRRPALVAGSGLLAMAVLAPAANFGVIQRLVTPGDATRTAGHILASAGLFRLAIAAFAAVVILDIVVAWALLKFFEPVHKALATLAAWLRISYRQAEALLKIQDFQDIWKVSLIVFGLYLVLLGYLACRSGYVPRLLGVLLVIAGGGYLIDSIAGLLSTSYTASVSSFTFIGEALFMLWLLLKGRKVALSA